MHKFKGLGLPVTIVALFCAALSSARIQDISLSENTGENVEYKKSNEESNDKYDPAIFNILANEYFDEDPVAETIYIGEKDDDHEKVQVRRKAPCTGCPWEVDVDEKIKDIASYALAEFSKDNGNLYESQHVYTSVVKAQTQVVSGIKYILKVKLEASNCTVEEIDDEEKICARDSSKNRFLCDFEIVEKVWLNSREVVLSQCLIDEGQNDAEVEDHDSATATEPAVTEAYTTEDTIEIEREDSNSKEQLDRKRRSTKLYGEVKDADENDERLRELAEFAIKQLDEIDADDDARIVLEILNVKKQVVQGWLYIFEISVSNTRCKEGKNATAEACRSKIFGPVSICKVKILFQPWQSVKQKVIESQCRPIKYRKGKNLDNNIKNGYGNVPIGGYSKVDPKDESIVKVADYVMNSFDKESNARHALKVIKIVEAQRQLVNGVKTKLKFQMGLTNCKKNDQKLDRSLCDIDEDKDKKFCKVTILEGFDDTKEIKKVSCVKLDLSKTSKKENYNVMKKEKYLAKSGKFSSDKKDSDHKKFLQFKKSFNKVYLDDEEHNYRFGIFKHNLKKIKLFRDTEQGTAEYGVTEFSDLTEEEFNDHHLGLRMDLKKNNGVPRKAEIPLIDLPYEYDWRSYNAVTPIKNQGMCGSCWAFSVTGNIEGLYAIKHHNLLSFSEQELLDCDKLDSACGGGLPENAYQALEKIGGLETEVEYPYDGKKETCQYKQSESKVKIVGYQEISKNETEMAMWLVKNGPISIGINANAMQFYFGGVSHPWKFLCNPKQLDHGVLIVGYGVHTTAYTHKKKPYWLVKNTWGRRWGEGGYYRVYRGQNTCGVAEMPTSAEIA